MDGVGEWVTGTWGWGRGNRIDLRKQMEFPHSLGLLYSAFTAFLGFEVNEGEYKVMGMAPYGQPRYVDKVWKLIRQDPDGSFSLDMDYFSFHHSTHRTFNRRFVDLFGDPRRFRMDHAYWGKCYGTSEIREFLEQGRIGHKYIENDGQLLDQVVERLQQGKVIGWFQDRFEWGPRALGNRSILGDPRNANMKDIINTKIKFREPYRPFAPSVLAECAEAYFDLPNAAHHYPARYMLYVVPVRPAKHAILPAITHVDGTGRLQTVFRDANPRYYGLIERFAQATGVPAILTTSFSLQA